MICGSFSMAGIPDGQQDIIAQGFATNVPPPLRVVKTRAADGSWTVTAQWPPCPAGTTTTHTTDAAPAATDGPR